MSDRHQDDIPEMLTLSDNTGKIYRLHFYDNINNWKLELFDSHTFVGYVNCHIYEDALKIMDINVFDAAKLPQIKFLDCIRSLLGKKPRTANYQGRGLGTELIKHVVERAKERHMTCITGDLFPRDLAINPNLPKWYQGHQFQVDMHPGGKSGKILLKLC